MPETSTERDWQTLAEKQRPDLQQASMAVQLAADKIRSARGSYLPTLGAMANYDFNNGTDHGYGNNYLVGVRLQWNIFDGGVKSAALKQAMEEKQAAEYERKQALQQTKLEISGAQDRRRLAQQQYRVAQQASDAAEEGLRIMENRHAEGLATTTDLLSVQVSRLQSRLNVLQALYQYTMEYAAMELAAGNMSLQSPLIAGQP
jgi:outer membrane protein